MTRFSIPLKTLFGLSYYRYELTSSNYNPNIDSTITLTVKVTDIFGNPVNNKTVQLYLNGSSLGESYQLTTNTNGVATATYTVTHFGIHDFSVANQHIQLEVCGWKQYYYDSATNGWYIRILYNETHTKVIINDPANVSFSTTETNYVTDVLTDSWIRPLKPISFFINFQRRLIVREGSANIVKVATTNGTGNIYAQLDWAHRGLP